MDQERELKWDDAIEHDGSDFILLDPGEYKFTVTGFERARHGGSAKLPPCNKAVLSVRIDDGEGNIATIQHNLFLHSKTEGLLCQFFRSIGARKSGERLVMDWSKVVGSRGLCKVGVRDWTAKNGTIKQSNEIERFLNPPGDGIIDDTDGEIPF